MRTSLVEDRFGVAPGATLELAVEVFNTRDVIDGVSARLVGLGDVDVVCDPRELALFPDTSGSMGLVTKIPSGFPAGEHVLELEIRSSVPGGATGRELVHLDVASSRELSLDLHPVQVVGRSKVGFTLVISNIGNVRQTLMLTATDPQNLMVLTFVQPTVDIAPGSSVRVRLEARARRRMLGASVSLPFTVVSRCLDEPEDGETDDPPASNEISGTFVQKPVLAAGLMTALLLAAIVAVWAGAMLLGLRTVLGRDPEAKTVPVSFYASSAAVQRAANGGKSAGAKGANAVPAGAVPKTGAATGIGGSLSGTVKAASTKRGIGRITVQAIHIDPKGVPHVVGAAASGDDGTYTITGLLPGPYVVHLSGDGIVDQWYPGASSESEARAVRVEAGEPTDRINATVEGHPVSVRGTVDVGLLKDTPGAVPPPVSIAVSRTDAATEKKLAKAKADSTGAFTLTDLVSPAAYSLTITAPGYQPSVVPVRVSAGQDVVLDTLHLSAGPGIIGGTVTDGSVPLGGVTITATLGDLVFKSATPTVGTVGQFTLPGLPTPGSYLITFSREGYSTVTKDVALGPGENQVDLTVALSQGAGTISGRVTDHGIGVGDATVRIDGGVNTVETQTLGGESGNGAYSVSGLAAPGTYTVTVVADGYGTTTIQVRLGETGVARGQNIELSSSKATLRGVVKSKGLPLSGITVTITDGTTVVTTTTVSQPAGEYLLSGIEAGRYVVTFSGDGYETVSVGVNIRPGQNTAKPMGLPAVQ